MITLENVSVRFGQHQVLRDVNLHLAPGEHMALMGPSGSGKTCLLRLLSGHLAPTSGKVLRSTERLSYMFQEPRLVPWLTAEENVNLVLGDSPSTLPQARLWLERVGLKEHLRKLPGELSGGMQQRVSLARALAYDGDVFLLDEPLSALDEETARQMLRLIADNTHDKALVLVTHSPWQAEQIAQSIYSIQDKTPVRR